MRKADLVKQIADKTGIAQIDVLISLEAFIKEVKESLKNGENVYIRGFGSFVLKKRRQKVGRIIRNNTAIVIPEHYIPSFKPANSFKELVYKSVPKKLKSDGD